MSERPDETFVTLMNQNLGIARKICRAYFPNHADQQDCLQEMMFQLWRSYSNFQGKSKFSTWMYQVCLNTALTYKRRNSSNHEALADHHLEISTAEESREDDINQLFRAIATLSPLNKAVILLYLDDLGYEEIAAVTGLSKTNVSVKLVRIKRELELILNTLKK
jgi:RNA polymerase sigma factor (sigma-70 family)